MMNTSPNSTLEKMLPSYLPFRLLVLHERQVQDMTTQAFSLPRLVEHAQTVGVPPPPST